MNLRWCLRFKFKPQTSTRCLALLSVFVACFYPSSTNRTGYLWFPVFGLQHDLSAGHVVVPLEEIFPSQTSEPETEVVRHALRIMEQHYVQREKLDPLRMLNGAVRALGRDYGGDIELGFLRPDADTGRLQLSGHRTIQLCPSSSRQSAEICRNTGTVDLQPVVSEGVSTQAVLRVGLRAFGVLLTSEPGLKSLELIGRFIIPEYARLKSVPVAQAIHTYLNGILDELDPHSSYMTREEYRELRSGTRGQFGGVGLVIDESQELPVIREVVPNSPAHMAGIRPGDVLLKVGKKISAFRTLDSVLRDIRDLAVDKAAPVWFFRPASRRVYRSFLAREEIPTRSAELRVVEGHPEVLHIRVTGFSNHTADDVQSLFEHGQRAARGKLKLILLDLRGNPGGLLDQAIQVSDLFIRQGKIVSTRSRFEEQVEQATRGAKIDLPLVVLVNSSSASASEIVAGALKDHGRALVVGERTFGKGSVQSLFELATGTALKLTVAHYFTPAGQSLQGVGIEPHIAIKLVQPKDDHLWMSGSSELDREEHLASHLLNPTKSKSNALGAHKVMLNMWVYSKSETQVLEGLRPINFAYPAGDNTKTLTRLEDDPLARVGVKMGSTLYGGRANSGVLTEKQLRDAYRKVALDEAQILRSSVDLLASAQNAVWRALPKTFFESVPEDRGNSSLSGLAKSSSSAALGRPGEGGRKASGERGFRDLINFFGVWQGGRDRKNMWPFSAPRLSLSASSLIAWQGPTQVLLSVDSSEVRVPPRSTSATGLLGLRLDDFHDGPVVWVPAQFNRMGDRNWMSSVRLPQAIRSYLSLLPASSDRPVVVGQLKWKLGDEPVLLGPLQIPTLARRHGRLSGQLVDRNGQKFLQVHFTRFPDLSGRSGNSSMSSGGQAEQGIDTSGLEVLMATLSDERVGVETDVVPLQRVADGEFRGETELKLSAVKNQGMGFSGLIGGIVRSSAGDVLLSAPLLWVDDDGVYAMEEGQSGRPVGPIE